MTEVAVTPRLYDRLRRIIPRSVNVNQLRHTRERPLHTTAFGCLHVRLVTLAFAWLQTLIHIVILGILALVIINPHLMHHWKMRFHHHDDHIVKLPPMPDVKQDNVPNFFQNLVKIARDHEAKKQVIYERKKREIPDNSSPFGFFHFVMHSEKTLPQSNGDNFVLDKTVTIEKGADGKLHSKQSVSVIDKNGHKVSMLSNPMNNDGIGKAAVIEPHYDMHHTYCRRHRLALFGLVTLNLFFCLLLVYGVTARRPVYMVPFMVVQLLFLFASSLCVLGYIASLPHIQKWLIRSHLPMKRELLRLNGSVLILICSTFIFVAYAFKAYMFVVVFRCYKYLKRDRAMQSRMNEVIRQSYDILPTVVVDDSKVKLPEYDDAVKIGAEKNMPPAYVSDGKDNKAYDTEEEVLKE